MLVALTLVLMGVIDLSAQQRPSAQVVTGSVAGARPAGVSRNGLEAAAYASLDLRVSRDVPLGHAKPDGPTLTLGVDAFNLTNRVNFATFVGTIGSPCTGSP